MNDYDIALRDFLTPMVNENRHRLLDKILEQRTRYLTVVLEDIYQPHNASAVLRTCDCFGIQDVHIIENRNRIELNPEVELGAAQWLTLNRYNKKANNTREGIENLKEKGYRIVAATPHVEDADVRDFNLSAGKTALLLGTEMQGLSDEAIKMSDGFVTIPMMGFTESFNISVSAAILLYELNTRLRSSGILWKIDPSEKELIRLQWLRNSINNIGWIEQGFKNRYAT
mgnify:CR=1 FL=1